MENPGDLLIQFLFSLFFFLFLRKLEKAVRFSGKFRRCWKAIPRSPGSTKCYACQGLGTCRQGKRLLESWPRLRERCWIFSSETATTFLSSSEFLDPWRIGHIRGRMSERLPCRSAEWYRHIQKYYLSNSKTHEDVNGEKLTVKKWWILGADFSRSTQRFSRFIRDINGGKNISLLMIFFTVSFSRFAPSHSKTFQDGNGSGNFWETNSN